METTTKDLPAAAPTEPTAEEKAKQAATLRIGAIAEACQAHGVLDIQAALVASGVNAQECAQVARQYAIASLGANDAQVKSLKALIKPGVTADGFTAAVIEARAAADANSPTDTALLGHEGSGASPEALGGASLDAYFSERFGEAYAAPKQQQGGA